MVSVLLAVGLINARFLVYGAVLGEADKAARPLTPDADDDSPIDEVTTSTKIVQL